MERPESERARLAAELLTSIPATLTDHDDGVAEAWHRDKELEADPAAGRTWDEIKRELGR
jgi:hypothetical protein